MNQDWLVEPLARSHERSEFQCGKPPLHRFIHSLVTQYEKRKLGRTFVAVRPNDSRVYGYYTLASSSVSFQSIPEPIAKRLPRHPVPVVLLARLAVDMSAQSQGLGRVLLTNAFRRCAALSKELGIHAIEVDAMDDDAKRFYQKYGFVSLLDDARHLVLPLKTIKDVLDG